MNKVNVKQLKLQGVEQLTRDELKNVVGGSVCLHEYWASGQYKVTCGVDLDSAQYACMTRKQNDSGYNCTISPEKQEGDTGPQ